MSSHVNSPISLLWCPKHDFLKFINRFRPSNQRVRVVCISLCCRILIYIATKTSGVGSKTVGTRVLRDVG